MEDQKVIGIVGGGQLAKNLTLDALPLGFKVIALEPLATNVAMQAGAEHIDSNLYDKNSLLELGEKSDYVTIEIEHLETKALKLIAKSGHASVFPSAATIELIQDKLAQKKFLANKKIAVAPFAEISSKKDALDFLHKCNSPIMVKTRFGAYNGLGNMLVRNEKELDHAWKKFAGTQLYAEKIISFSKELAVMAARDVQGNVVLHPITETIHKRNICQETLTPAAINDKIKQKAEKVARKTVATFHDVGIFGIEMFLTQEDEILINEVAPRVHNSGHYTLNGCLVSQFEQHIRAITGLPLGSTDLLAPACVMVNILGERNGPTRLKGLDKALAVPGVAVHIYGKSPTKVDRKMGHINAIGSTIKQARDRARKARKLINI